VEAIKSRGLRVEGVTDLHLKIEAATGIQDFEPELVLLTVKAYDTEKAVRESLEYFTPETVVMSLQNGLDNLEKITRYMGDRVLVGLTSHGVTFVDFGIVRHAGVGDTVVGDPTGGRSGLASEVVDELTRAGIETRISTDIYRELWLKAAVNAAINPITCITGLNNGSLLEMPHLTRILEGAAREVAAVAHARGVDLGQEEAVEKAKEVARLTANNKSSMLQDIERCRKTEIDSINGAVARYGQEAGVDTPVNTLLTGIVKGIEASQIGKF
jgi:2-dehydropantoate 2-reductase